MGHRRDLCMNCIWVQLRSFTISINQQSLYTDYDDDDDDDDDVGLDVLGCRVDTDYIVYIIYIYILPCSTFFAGGCSIRTLPQ